MKIGLAPIADRIASVAIEASRGKRGAQDTRRRIAAAVTPMLEEAALIGLEQAMIAARAHAGAVNAIVERRRELEHSP